jgi:hypothetical protein
MAKNDSKQKFLARGTKPLGPRIEEITTMDIIGELLAINRCLRSPAFRPGNMVQFASGGDTGRVGTVVSVRLLIAAEGFGNEYEVLWVDGQTAWVDGRDLTSPAGNACLPAGREERSHAHP